MPDYPLCATLQKCHAKISSQLGCELSQSPTASKRSRSSRSFAALRPNSSDEVDMKGEFPRCIPEAFNSPVLSDRGDAPSGNVPCDTVVLSVPVNAPRPIFYRGGLLASSAIALRHTEEVDFRSAGFLDMLTIAVDEDRLQQLAIALWGEPLDARRKRQRLPLAEPAARGRLVARLLQLLDVAERDSNRVAEYGPRNQRNDAGNGRF